MFFKGTVYFESRLEWKFDIQSAFNDFIIQASRAGIKLEVTCKQVNYSWKHDQQWQVITDVNFENDDDVYNITASEALAKRFLRDMFDVFMTNRNLTPAYIEDAEVETDDGDPVTVPDFYFIDCNDFNDAQDDNLAKAAWENFKRSDDFMEFVAKASASPKNFLAARKELAELRKENAAAGPVKVKKRNMKHLNANEEVESKANDKRKIYILDEDVV